VNLQILMPIVLMAVFLAYTIYTMRKRKTGMPEAFRMFFERTGYRYADILDQPLEAHLMHGETLMRNARKQGYHIHMVRDYHGVPIHSLQDQSYGKDGSVRMSYAWTSPLTQPPRVLVQIADRSLSGAGKAVKEAFSNMERKWEPLYSTEIESGDPELDKRFRIFGEDPTGVQQALATPGLRDLLLGCAEVDLAVRGDEIRFADPMQKNIRASMGGNIGMMAMGSNMQKMMEMTIPIHDRMAQLLATTRQACA
jgi:hypothetical protein